MSSSFKFVGLMIMFCLTGATCLSQVSTATITGVVQDATGALVPGAKVIVTETQTNKAAETVTDASGVFSLPALPVGPYSMRVVAAGFSNYARTNIVLTVGQVANFQVQLLIGAASETVTVQTGAPLINQTEPTLASEDVIYATGNHEITFGGNLHRIHNGQANPAGQTGVIIYAGVFTNILGTSLGCKFKMHPLPTSFSDIRSNSSRATAFISRTTAGSLVSMARTNTA